ncbi:SdiA-regulated domain-containing protein [Fluviibacterium sp. DFM31]|uniref:SdiA-regulated domain-containing protein n=1 Tax=Meridianimarinicoccus marinus TaxID=3231483 RepID=A0ABV3LAP4_9RHOB
MRGHRRWAVLGALCAAGIAGHAGADCGTPSVRFLDSEKIARTGKGYAEPSGLSLAGDGEGLLSVSDDTAAIFRLRPDGGFGTRHDIALAKPDLEGVAWDMVRNRILTVNEGAAEILVTDPHSWVSKAFPLSKMQGYPAVEQVFATSDPNDLLEGIAVDPARDLIFVLKEKRPRLLLEISPDLTEILRATELTPALGFVDDDQGDWPLDVSGVSVDGPTGCLWIVSDRGQRLFLFDPAGDSPARSFALGWLKDKKPQPLPHAEGIAHDPATDRLMIVNDDGKASRLFTFEVLRGGAPD